MRFINIVFLMMIASVTRAENINAWYDNNNRSEVVVSVSGSSPDTKLDAARFYSIAEYECGELIQKEKSDYTFKRIEMLRVVSGKNGIFPATIYSYLCFAEKKLTQL